MLKQRIITAFLLSLAIVTALVFLPFKAFCALLLLVWLIAGWEWADMAGFSSGLRYVYAALTCVVTASVVWQSGLLDQQADAAFIRYVVLTGGLWWLIALLLVVMYPRSAVIWGGKQGRALMGFLVLLPAAVALMYLLSLPQGKWYFVYMVFIVAAADIGAYFTGRAFGKRKLIPQVSPGKSWAGFWGGVASCMLLALITGWQFDIAGLSLVQLLLITVVAGLASVLGDLLESMVKRQRGIKDSSQLLPGHGGFMDRIDSVTAAAPVFVLLLLLVKA